MVSMIFAFVHASGEKAVESSMRALSGLWADSILSEYDLNLQKRYQLFGFYGDSTDVREKVAFYMKDSLDSKRYIDTAVESSSLYDYSLVNTSVFESQIVAAGKLAFTETYRNPARTIMPVAGYTEPFDTAVLFSDLPSAGSTKAYSLSAVKELLGGNSTIGDALNKAGKDWWVSQYIFAYFKDASDDKALGDTYLQNEIEYIICGKKSDSANQATLRNRIIALREAVNLAYLMKDPVKSNEAFLAAQLLTPGPAAAVTQKALLAAWALAESINDYKLLRNGKLVPIRKTASSWAVDLESVIANKADGYIDTGTDQGECYRDYLRLFICAMDRNVRLLRMMDLIQINMRRFYYENFSLREYHGGVQFVLTVNGKAYETEKTYEKMESETASAPK